MTIVSKMIAAGAALAMLSGTANAACWTDAAYQAAQVRELDTMMMVEALRCRKTPASFLTDYNRFVQTSRPTLLAANAALRTHFAEQAGERGALNAYDNYMTTVANRYGAGTEGLACEDMAIIVNAALEAGGSTQSLNRVAAAAQVRPLVSDDRCQGRPSSLTIASRR